MFITCPVCSRVHSTAAARTGQNPQFIACPCGNSVPIPPEPKETWGHKLRDRLGERIACGLVGAATSGIVIWFGVRDGSVFVSCSGALAGFIVGALLGEKILGGSEHQ